MIVPSLTVEECEAYRIDKKVALHNGNMDIMLKNNMEEKSLEAQFKLEKENGAKDSSKYVMARFLYNSLPNVDF